ECARIRGSLWVSVAIVTQLVTQLVAALLVVCDLANRAVVCDPRRLQLDHPPGRMVHLRYGQAEPAPKASEPFAAGPGDRFLQLPPLAEVSRTRLGGSIQFRVQALHDRHA